ncbi:hypothetical protein, conserved in T.vivax [Trypanosoma vivax Y486]|uniref:Trypanosome variant surface glycoprotein A-type N-terminal domain-containing protein n=1 Tax=Trypanosoma vivax (strain Y486) TaxID=1055687 RepID=F9WKT3_TRYVY|nr:hypothetical protein, conserved in T.vivax [Trypanosoma vivax Y486]|eukprot:CCD18109.1 hypothetical protein, conserved in T.vivax [Trypanosoma vivax Y486]
MRTRMWRRLALVASLTVFSCVLQASEQVKAISTGAADAVCAVITTLRKATLETGRIGSLVGAAVKQSSEARVLVAKRRALEKARAVEHALVETGEPARDADPAVAAAAQKAEKALNTLLRVADKMEERVTEVTATQVTKFAQGVANANRAADILEVFVTALGLTTRIQHYGTAQGQQKCINTGNTAAKLKCEGNEQASSGLTTAVDAVGKLAFNVGVGQSGTESCTAASGNIEADSSSGATSGTKCGCPILFWASKGAGTGTEWTTELANVNDAKTTLDEKDRYWERARAAVDAAMLFLTDAGAPAYVKLTQDLTAALSAACDEDSQGEDCLNKTTLSTRLSEATRTADEAIAALVNTTRALNARSTDTTQSTTLTHQTRRNALSRKQDAGAEQTSSATDMHTCTAQGNTWDERTSRCNAPKPDSTPLTRSTPALAAYLAALATP